MVKKQKHDKNRVKQPKFQDIPDEVENDNVGVAEEDLEFLEEYKGYAGFLLKSDYMTELSRSDIFSNNLKKDKTRECPVAAVSDELTSSRKKRKNDYQEEEEADYEKIPRKISSSSQIEAENNQLRLLIKDASGKWKSVDNSAMANRMEDNNDITDSADQQSPREDPEHGATFVSGDEREQNEPSLSYHVKIEQIAHISSSIVENPQENISQLKTLRQFARDDDIRVVKLALVSQMAVYKDVIPGYRIRKLTEKEKVVKVSKEVKALRQFEETLVINYQAYLKLLEEIADSNHKIQNGIHGLVMVSVKCMCDMLLKASHFNFRVNLMTSIVSRMNFSGKIGELCCQCVSDLFLIDEKGDISLELVKLISQLVKKNLRVKSRVIDPLFSLQLSDDIKKREVAKSRKDHSKHVSKRKKKENKIAEEVRAEMKEANATLDYEEKLTIQSEILKHLFVIYFRILKDSVNRRSKLLVACLKGIQKFGHLISIDYFENVVQVIRDIVSGTTGMQLTPVETALCVNTSFFLFNLQEGLVSLDLKDMYENGYRSIRESFDLKSRKRVTGTEKEDEYIQVLAEMIRLMFFCRPKHDIVATRAAAFVKRILILCCRLSNVENVILLLNLLKKLIIRSPVRVQQMLIVDEEERPFSSGVYLTGCDNPDLCNPFSASMEELEELKSHDDKRISKFVVKEFLQFQKS